MSEWLLAVHSGAGRYGSANEAAYLSLLRSALESGREAINRANRPPTAAQIAAFLLQSFEHSALTNAGLGANLTEQRRVECEASVACGRTRLVGACAAVSGVREPSALALKLLEQAETVENGDTISSFAFGRQPPLVLVGEHAREIARSFGLETASEDVDELKRYQVTEQSEKHWEKWHRRFQSTAEATEKQAELGENGEEERLDTVGAICLDPMGNVAVALSSGGVAYKVPGRVGLAGCPRMGCDAANAVIPPVVDSSSRKRKRSASNKPRNAFAVACTGRGEHFMRSNFVGMLTRRLAKSADLERGLRKTFIESREANGGVGVEGGVLALVPAQPYSSLKGGSKPQRVQLGVGFTTPCMGVGFLQCRPDVESKPQVQLLRRPRTHHSATNSDDAHQLSIHVSFLNLNSDLPPQTTSYH